jgi:DNA-binding FrmR family transcriptional regulator
MENHNNTLSNRYRQIAGQLVGIDASVDEKKSPLSGLFSFPSKK